MESFQLEQTLAHAARLLYQVCTRVNEGKTPAEERNGGYLCVHGQQFMDAPSAVIELGSPMSDKRSKYFVLSQEKARRLVEHSEHRSSWQSRDEANVQWGGAIRTGTGVVLSFSGLPEMFDEAFMLLLAKSLGVISTKDAFDIAEISSNSVFKLVYDDVFGDY